MLQHITVLSLEQATTLPFLTYRLACDGARVIRVEHPAHPDPNRFVGSDVLGEEGMRSYFLPNNCGKEAITLNLATADGQALLRELIVRLPVDVFACNQRPRSYARLGIDYETLARLRPDLIWLGISGFGPEHDEPAYDPVLQARAGFMELTGEPGGRPLAFGLPMVDLGAAEHGYGQLMKALYLRAKTGAGSRIDVSMFRSAVSWMVSPLLLTGSFGETVTRRGNRHQFFAPVGVYPTRDGYVYVAVGNDRQWAALVAAPVFTGLARPEYTRNTGRIADADALNAALATCFERLETDAVFALLHAAGVPVARVHTVEAVLADPLVAPELVRVTDPRSGRTVVLPAPPAGPPAPLRFPPRLGEHNGTIYGETLRLGADALADLERRGVI
jgi:formyl-CoA transferase